MAYREPLNWTGVMLTWVVGVVVAIAVLVTVMWALPQYGVYQRALRGEAALAEAESDRRIRIEEAQAELEAADLDRQSEVIRANGVAEANAIIGTSLQGNEAYLRYLWIQGLHDGTSETIYIPTEGNLPILEATRRVVEE